MCSHVREDTGGLEGAVEKICQSNVQIHQNAFVMKF